MTLIGDRRTQVDQAIFASSDRGSMKGYQLVARSSGVDRTTARALCRWMPSQIASDDPAQWSINYFPVDDKRVAVTRTVLGGPEYSNRGGTEVVTIILLMTQDQFQGYFCNSILVVRTALAVGMLRLPLERDALPLADLPVAPLVDVPPTPFWDTELDSGQKMLDDIAASIMDGQRIALIGHPDPAWAASRLIRRLSLDDRRNFSFTTGLNPTVRRPFQAHFLPAADLARQRTLDSQKIKRFDWSSL